MQDLAITASPPRLPIQDKPRQRAPKIGKKLFAAIDFIVFDGADLQEAAAQAGLTTFTLRQAFGRAHVIAHLKARREVLRAAASGKNIHRLCEIRDAGNNQPAVNAIKALEQLGDEQAQRGSGASASPGVTIRIVNVNAAAGDSSLKTVATEINQQVTRDDG